MPTRRTTAPTRADGEDLVRGAVAALEAGMVLCDAAGSVVHCNPSACRLLGWSADEAAGRPIWDPAWRAVGEDGSPFPAAAHPAVVTLASGEPCTQVVMGLGGEDGERRWLAIDARPLLRCGETTPYAVAVSLSDVTRFKAAEEELKRNVAAAREAEERLRLLQAALEHASDAVIITTPGLEAPDPRVLYVNPAFTRMTGYSQVEMLGRSPRVLQGEKTERGVLERVKREMRLGRAASAETVNYRKDGSEFRVEWTISPIHDRRGRVTHWMAMQRDVTRRRRQEEERRLVEEALRVSEARHRALTEALPDFVLRIGRDGTYLDCRGGRSEPLRQRPAELLGRRLTDVLPAPLAARIGRGIDRALGTGEMQIVEYDLEVRGESRSFETRLVQSGAQEVLAVVRDITERRRSEERQDRLQAVISKAAQEWQLTVDAIASPLLLLEPEGRILRMNEAARRLAGVEFQDAVLKPLARLGKGEPWKAMEALLGEVVAQLTTATVQVSDRKGRTWDVAVSPVNGQSRPLRLLAVALDVEAGLTAAQA